MINIEDIIFKFKKLYVDKTIEIDTDNINYDKDEVILVSIRDDFDRNEKDYFGKIGEPLCKVLKRMAIDYGIIKFKDIENEIAKELDDAGYVYSHYDNIQVSIINPVTVDISYTVRNKTENERMQKHLNSMHYSLSSDKRICKNVLNRYFNYETDVYSIYDKDDINKIFNINFNLIIVDPTELGAKAETLTNKFYNKLFSNEIDSHIDIKTNNENNSMDITLECPDNLFIDMDMIKDIYKEYEKDFIINFYLKQINKDVYYLREKFYYELAYYKIYEYNIYLAITDKNIDVNLECPTNTKIDVNEIKEIWKEYEINYIINFNVIKVDNFTKNQ